MIKKEIQQDLDGDDLTRPPCWLMTRPPPSAPPGPEAALRPDPGPGEVPAAAAALPPALPEFVEPLFWQAPVLVTEASGQHFQDPGPAEPPKLYRLLPEHQ
ncbi:ankyrin repeat domain-containing protein 11-like isoform X2 [Dama dama]|uniref:ankyrin repeat domain-containing protein 11-like isoform X2 n=1 Tax=Dama dama TaxID=30532 RepID=UPI002A35FBD0|nr:ankyrin repeat domain-containing protein 11-like isoform X2 [Dama dama]